VTAIKIDPYINVDAGTMNPQSTVKFSLLMMVMRLTRISAIMKILDRDILSTNYMTTEESIRV